MLPRVFYGMNVIDAGIVSVAGIDEMLSTAAHFASPAKLLGGSSTSLEAEGTELSYRLMDGVAVASRLPRLQSLYENEFLSIAQRVFDVPLVVAPDVVYGANINVLEGAGGRYEWHVDSNPYTALLALSPSSASIGGRLLFGENVEDRVALSMKQGDLFFFDARETAHAVEELATHRLRVTVPMNFFVAGEPVTRPHDLDDMLYNAD